MWRALSVTVRAARESRGSRPSTSFLLWGQDPLVQLTKGPYVRFGQSLVWLVRM